MGVMQRRQAIMQAQENFIPPEYQKAYYLESTGTQYINTGVYTSNTFGIDIEYYTKNEVGSTGYGCIFGGRYSSGNNDLQLTTYTGSTSTAQGSFRFGDANTGHFKNPYIIKDTKQRFRFRNRVMTRWDGAIASETSIYSWTYPREIYLFLLNNNDTAIQGGVGCRIYNAKIYDGDTLVRNYVPCYRKSDYKPGLYDTVTHQLYTNQGTGEFIVSEIMSDNYARCNYLTGTGNRTWIDTGIAGNDNTIQMDFTIEVLSRSSYMGAMLGNHDGEDKKCWRFIQGASGTNDRFNFTLNSRRAGASPALIITGLTSILNIKFPVHMEYNRATMIYNGSTYSVTGTESTEEVSTKNIIIGSNGPNATGGSSTVSYARFHDRFIIRKQGKVVRHYVPVIRVSDSKPGFYDLVNNTFNPSSGDLDYIAG